MDDPTRPEFDILDSEGLEYYRWVSDVETTFVAKDYTATIKDPENDGLSDKVKASALMFLRRHIDHSLRWEYLQLKTPKELWDALKERFGNVHDTLLPELIVKWNEIRLLDYKRVNDFNRDMLRLKARLHFCGKELTEDDMIQKTLSTFPTSTVILANLANRYKLEYDNKRITAFNKLVNLLQVAEKVAERHNEVLLTNNVWPVGIKKIPVANYGKMNSGKNLNAKWAARVDPYPRDNNAPRGRGRGDRGIGRGGGGRGISRGSGGRGISRGGGGRGIVRGGPSEVWRNDGGAGSSDHGSKVQKAVMNPPVKKERAGDEPCYRCGIAGHWYKNCNASNKVAAYYKRYIKSKEQKTHYMEKEHTASYVNFSINKEYAQSMNAPDLN